MELVSEHTEPFYGPQLCVLCECCAFARTHSKILHNEKVAQRQNVIDAASERAEELA